MPREIYDGGKISIRKNDKYMVIESNISGDNEDHHCTCFKNTRDVHCHPNPNEDFFYIAKTPIPNKDNPYKKLSGSWGIKIEAEELDYDSL